MPQLGVRHILNVNPLDLKLAFELVLHPNTTSGVAVVHTSQHFSHAAKVTGTVNGKKQVDGALAVGGTFLGLVGRIQTFVAMVRRTPDFVLDATMYVVLAKALDDKVASVFGTHIKALGVIFVNAAQVLQNWVTTRHLHVINRVLIHH